MEKYKKRNLITWIITGCVALAILLTLCFKFVYIDQSIGDFRVRMYINKCYILGTTEQGNNQRYLIIPEKIKGRKVEYIGTPRPIVGGINRANIGSTVIERVYCEKITFGQETTFSECPNIKKIFYIEDWGTKFSKECNYYYTPEKFKGRFGLYNTQNFPANVLYRYNYDGAENDGYYWIDNCDYGTKIEYIPENPEQEGYTFAGWYKEPECINEWDFGGDTLPESKLDEEGREVYQETRLYAKWNKLQT